MGDPSSFAHPHPLRRLALAVMAGVLAGWSLPFTFIWLLGGSALCIVAVACAHRGRLRMAGHWGLLATAAFAASWLVLRVHHTSDHDIRQYVMPEPQLAEVVGIVDEPPSLRSYDRGAFGRFNWENPATLLVLRLESIRVKDTHLPVHGRVLARISEWEPRVREGQRLRCTGWLSPIHGPNNPGEHDFAASLSERGVFARLSMTPGVYERLPDPPLTPFSALRALRSACARAADESLRVGLEDDPVRLGLLRTLLLGQRSGDLREVRDQFTRVGLAHVLSISGAHLVILMTLVFGVSRLLFARPSRAAALALAVLILYLLAIPAYVPIVRAGIASGVFLLGFATGRRVQALDLLALATVVVLIWRPMELFSAGFQLSFGGVLALLLWTRPVSLWLYPAPLVPPRPPPWWDAPARRAVEACAASIVACAFTMPIVAWHFAMVSPLAALFSVASVVPITLLLWVGYVKVLLGPLLPSLSLLLAGPAAWLTDMVLALVAHAASWRASSLPLSQPPNVLWTAAALLCVMALFRGWFARRRAAAGCVAAVLLLWAGPLQRPRDLLSEPPAASLTMIAVGDGSCFLLRLPHEGGTLMFDCGSGQYFDVGERSVVPALRKLGVAKIDTLFVSHADLDHFSGVLDMMDALPVGRVCVPPQLLHEAAQQPHGASAFLIAQLRDRDAHLETLVRGHREVIGDATLDVLWPPPDYTTKRSNDHSLVICVSAAGRRLLLHGDAQDEALGRLLALDDLAADVTDLPHHGGFVKTSPSWLAEVSPAIALQSCGYARLRTDPWLPHLSQTRTDRYITARHGMTTVAVDKHGRLSVTTFR